MGCNIGAIGRAEGSVTARARSPNVWSSNDHTPYPHIARTTSLVSAELLQLTQVPFLPRLGISNRPVQCSQLRLLAAWQPLPSLDVTSFRRPTSVSSRTTSLLPRSVSNRRNSITEMSITLADRTHPVSSLFSLAVRRRTPRTGPRLPRSISTKGPRGSLFLFLVLGARLLRQL